MMEKQWTRNHFSENQSLEEKRVDETESNEIPLTVSLVRAYFRRFECLGFADIHSCHGEDMQLALLIMYTKFAQ